MRALYAATSPQDVRDRAALQRAGRAVVSAFTISTNRRREKELGHHLAVARRELEEAAQAVRWAARPLRGVLALLRPLGGRTASRADDPQRPVPMPPFWERGDPPPSAGR